MKRDYTIEQDICSAKIVGITKPILTEIETPGELISFCARVSNPSNQLNKETSDKLLAYLARNAHWSPFEMVNVVMEVKTTRDIARQVLRHRSFTFQEFSQRYAEQDTFYLSIARMQDDKNRQNSIETDDEDLKQWWKIAQEHLIEHAFDTYKGALRRGIAKEVARKVLPEGLTESTMYINGNVRSWIHYCNLRRGNGTQMEHMFVAEVTRALLADVMPEIAEML